MTAEAEIKEDPMGEAGRDALRVCSDRTVKLEFQGCDGPLGRRIAALPRARRGGAAAEMLDLRTGRNIPHGMAALLRQSIYSRLAGYEDVNDADRLGVDPVMRQVVGGLAAEVEGSPPFPLSTAVLPLRRIPCSIVNSRGYTESC